MTPTPTRADNFCYGFWTVGWQAPDMFGESTRPALVTTLKDESGSVIGGTGHARLGLPP